MNIAIITGNVTKVWNDAPGRAKISIADNYKENTTYIPVMLFNQNADWAVRNVQVGDHINVQATIGTYKDSAGTERVSIIGQRISFEGYKNPKKQILRQPATQQAAQMEAVTDNDIPF